MTRERELIETRWQLALCSPLHFGRWFCRTLDSQNVDHPIQAFPMHKPHLQALTRLWLANPWLFVEKSRQMLVTWWAAMLSAWLVLARPGSMIFQQSKKLQDVVGNEVTGDGLLGRTKFILRAIPYQEWLMPARWQDGILSDSITLPWRNSAIQAIAEGGSQLRSHTASMLVTDETAVQPEFAEAYTASVASLRRSRWLAITTPNLADGGQSMRIARDQADSK